RKMHQMMCFAYTNNNPKVVPIGAINADTMSESNKSKVAGASESMNANMKEIICTWQTLYKQAIDNAAVHDIIRLLVRIFKSPISALTRFRVDFIVNMLESTKQRQNHKIKPLIYDLGTIMRHYVGRSAYDTVLSKVFGLPVSSTISKHSKKQVYGANKFNIGTHIGVVQYIANQYPKQPASIGIDNMRITKGLHSIVDTTGEVYICGMCPPHPNTYRLSQILTQFGLSTDKD